MAHRKKCPECNSCLAPRWIMPNRYYYCDFCLTYYGGRDDALYLVPKEQIYEEMKRNQENGDNNTN